MKASDAAVASGRRAPMQRGAPAAQPAPHVERVVHARDATAGQAIGMLLESALRQVDDNARAWRASAHPEALHQLRVGIRRLRATLANAKRVLPASTLPDELGTIAQMLGAARDVDVFIDDTLPAVRAAANPAARRDLDALQLAAQRRRAAARRAARAVLAGPRMVRVKADAAALAAACARGNDPLAEPAREFARAVLKRRHRRLSKRLQHVAALDVDERHALRIATKKLRYAADGFASLYPAARVGRYRHALARLQSALGSMNDAAVALALAEDLAAGTSACSAMHAWAARREAELGDELRRSAQRFEHVRRFWTRG